MSDNTAASPAQNTMDAPKENAAGPDKPSGAGAKALSLTNNHGRGRAMSVLGVLFLACGLAFAVYWFLVLRFEESTDNAYVAANLVRISPRISGNIEALYADNNDAVRAGQVLVRLDSTDAELALKRARAALADTVRQTGSLMAESSRLASLVALRKRELEKARGDLVRRKDRKTAMAVSEEELSHAKDDLAIAELALKVAQDDLQRNSILLQDSPLEDQPLVKQQAQALREAWLALQRCVIKSPVNGYVARRAAQLGMRVEPGTPLMAVVPLAEVWVDANFKEVQLKKMRVGQKAVVKADLYGSSLHYEGVVAGFSAGTGSSFSLLPPENATGNWIKVVQRVPVKILLNAAALEEKPLLVGLSCDVLVDVSDGTGAMLKVQDNAGSAEPFLRTSVLDEDFSAIDREIADIIRSNAAGIPKGF